MNRTYKNLFVVLGLMVTFSACLKNTNIEVEKMPPKIVIHSYNQTGNSFRLYASKSANILDVLNWNSDRTLQGVDIDLYRNDIKVDHFVPDSSGMVYITENGTKAEPGIRYKIKATKEGMAPVESEAFLSDQFPAILSTTIKKKVKKIDYNEVDEILIRIADPPGVENYYMFKFLIPYYYEVTDTLFYYGGSYCIYTSDPDIDNARIDPLFADCISGDLIVSDKNFNGKEKEFAVYVRHGTLTESADSLNSRIYRPIFQLHNITADDFKYKKSIMQYDRASNNPFAEPVSVFTNIRNGYGVFSITHIQTDTIR